MGVEADDGADTLQLAATRGIQAQVSNLMPRGLDNASTYGAPHNEET